MSQFMRAHGYLPGPTQRPTMAGLLAGAAAELVAIVPLWRSGALQGLSHGNDVRFLVVLAVGVPVMILAGALYGRIFMRAANDRRGGWLFGISYGFLLWMLGPASLLPWILGRVPVVGRANQGLFASCLVYGLALGLLFPVAGHLVVSRRR